MRRPVLKVRAPDASRLAHWDKRFLWHPFTQQAEWEGRAPIIIQSAKGVWLRDRDGRRLLDGNSSLWVNVWGHRRPELDRALKTQIDKISHSTFLGLTHEPAIRLAKKLIEIAPKGLSRVFYSDNGSTAVEVALKMAYQYWQLTGCSKKTRFVSLKDGYHGDTIGSVSVGGIDLFHSRFRHLLFKGRQVHASRLGSSPILMHRDQNASKSDLTPDIDAVLRRHHRETAAVVVEPLVQGASGIRLLPAGYLKHIERLCRRYGVFLIVDEVATGFGRTGTMFACEQEDVRPDFLCVAKSITGGYLPLAATMTTETVYQAFTGRFDEFKAFFHGHTYTANPLACAVALENLELYAKKGLLMNVRRRTLQMKKILNRIYKASQNNIYEIRQIGLMAGIELRRGGRDPFAPGERMGLKVCDAAIRRGVWLRPLGDVIVLMPPLAITEKELEFLLTVVGAAIEEVMGSGDQVSRSARISKS